jgi:hypothetical protein
MIEYLTLSLVLGANMFSAGALADTYILSVSKVTSVSSQITNWANVGNIVYAEITNADDRDTGIQSAPGGRNIYFPTTSSGPNAQVGQCMSQAMTKMDKNWYALSISGAATIDAHGDFVFSSVASCVISNITLPDKMIPAPEPIH